MNINDIGCYKELLSPEEFIKLTSDEKDKIEETKIIFPKLGEKGFGKILVIYKPTYFKKGKHVSPEQYYGYATA